MSHCETLLHQAMDLPLDQRAMLAHALLATLDADENIERDWEHEILSRRSDIQIGRAATIDSDALFRSLGA